jgi:F-box interacting protein
MFLLFNPSTREYNLLPEWPYSNEFKEQDEYSISGFGYNSHRNDYEVIRIGYDISDSKYGDCLASLYSLKTNSWRRINASPPCRRDPSFEDSVGILSNGTLHWLLKYQTPFKNS